MSRYFYYLFLLGMFINTIFFVPRILLSQRFDGAVPALVVAVVIGTLFAVLFSRAMNRFPGEGLPEIFAKRLPGLIRVPFIVFLAIMWFMAGSIILISFSQITGRFLNPETNPTLLLVCFCVVSWWAATSRPMAILNAAEIVIMVQLPVVIYIMFKSLGHPMFQWDDIKVLTDYAWRIPSWTAVATATYPFTGYINHALYNRVYKDMKIKHQWLIPVLGTFVLFTSFFVPIGLLGVDSVGDYLYTWISAADTLRSPFGFIERVVFLFLFVYIGFSLLFITVTWNIACLLLLSCFPKEAVTIKRRRIPIKWILCGCFAVATFFWGVASNDKRLLNFVAYWQSVRFATEFALVAVVVWLARRRKHA